MSTTSLKMMARIAFLLVVSVWFAQSVEAATTCPCSIWNTATIPAVAADPDPNAVELGLKFQASVNGFITGIRFYKGTGNTGTHMGHLWSSTGTLLASVTFTNETATGWQQATLTTPVAITANTTYVVSYYAPAGHYAVNEPFFTTAFANTPLQALASGAAGGNGVYKYGTSGFPTQTFNMSNYWVDVVFNTTAPSDTTPPTVALTAPANEATVSGSITVAATASDDVGVVGVQFKLDGNNLGSEDTAASYAITWNSTTVANGTHTFTAVARDAAGSTTTSPAVTVTVNNTSTDTTPPTVPANLQASAVSATQINLSWSASTDNVGVTGYRVYRSGTQIATTTSTSYSVTGLSPATAYSFTVAAYDAAGNVSAQSVAASATTSATPDTTAPTVPTNLTATAVSTTQINLAWSASTDNVGVTGYRVLRSGTQIATATSTSYAVTGLAPRTIYSFTVAAFDAAGNVSAQSTAASATTLAASDTTAPTVPTNLTATAVSTTQINLAWSASTDNVGVTGYRVLRSGTQIGTATSTSYAVTGLAPGTLYSFTVAAFDAAGNVSAPSNTAATNTFPPPSPDPTNLPLLHQSDLVYKGAFRLPQGTLPGAQYGFDYAATVITYNPQHNTLFINNHIYEQKTGEVSIPQPVNSTNLNSLPIATILQNPADITEGNLGEIGASGQVICGGAGSACTMGGLMVYNTKLIGTAYAAYDAGKSTVYSHFTAGLTLAATGDFKGMYMMQTNSPAGPSFVDGYMTQIPSEWQAAFGGPALTGNCCLSIISRTSYGPSAFVFNPDDVGVKEPIPATPVVYYDSTHPTLGAWDHPLPPNSVFNLSTQIRGIVFPGGTRSVLFFGTTGLGDSCYGTGGSSGGDCYDPDDSSKGGHAYPYAYYVWAYDANDLLMVKKGQKTPWDIRPYTTWSYTLPFGDGAQGIQGAAYDPTTRRIFVSQLKADGQQPVIHVFQVP